MKRYYLFCDIYDSSYPKSVDVVFELYEPFYAENDDEAIDKAYSVLKPLLSLLFPDADSSSGVRGDGLCWTFTDIM